MKTISLELAKQLKEAGYPQEDTYFAWNVPNEILHRWSIRDNDYIAAPTADEILDRLPQDIWKNGKRYQLVIDIWSDKEYLVNYTVRLSTEMRLIEDSQYNYEHGLLPLSDILANAAAKMFLYLKKEGLLPAE